MKTKPCFQNVLTVLALLASSGCLLAQSAVSIGNGSGLVGGLLPSSDFGSLLTNAVVANPGLVFDLWDTGSQPPEGTSWLVLRVWDGPNDGAAQSFELAPPPEVRGAFGEFESRLSTLFVGPVQQSTISPVPEPSSLSLLAVASASALAFKRRFRPSTR